MDDILNRNADLVFIFEGEWKMCLRIFHKNHFKLPGYIDIPPQCVVTIHTLPGEARIGEIYIGQPKNFLSFVFGKRERPITQYSFSVRIQSMERGVGFSTPDCRGKILFALSVTALHSLETWKGSPLEVTNAVCV